MHKFILILFVVFASCNKKTEQEQKPAILALQEMGDLATVEYTVTKIIKASDNKTWFKLGDRKILMSAEANIKAGIDLTDLSEKNFRIEGKDVQVVLPEPKIISVSIPAEKIKVEYQEVSVFRDRFSSKERDMLATQAEKQIFNNLGKMGILEQAKASTSLLINNILKQAGYENISISYGHQTPVLAR